MLQHKQEERKLKRIEGDIVKKQRLLRRVMNNYDNGQFFSSQQLAFCSLVRHCKFNSVNSKLDTCKEYTVVKKNFVLNCNLKLRR